MKPGYSQSQGTRLVCVLGCYVAVCDGIDWVTDFSESTVANGCQSFQRAKPLIEPGLPGPLRGASGFVRSGATPELRRGQ